MAIANNTSMNTVYKNFLSSYVQLIGFISRSKIAGSYGNSFHTVHRILKARILKWFAILFSSGPHFFRTLHHDPLILGGPAWCNSVSLSKIRLWSMWLDWLVFCDCGFQSVCPLMEKDKRLMEASWWERLTVGETGFCSDRRGHAQYIFNPIFCWWVRLCSFTVVWPKTKLWLIKDQIIIIIKNQTSLMKIMATYFKRSPTRTASLSAPDTAACHHWPIPLLETTGHTQASLAQSSHMPAM